MSLREALPANHLARFVVDIVAELDLAHIYERYGLRGGEAYAPELLLALLFYGYATGVFSSRKIEKATCETLPFRFVAGGLHPDHDTLANFRKTFRAEIKDLFVQVLLLAQAAGYLKLGNISMDGSKVHANASKSKAVSYKRLLALEGRLRAEVDQLFRLAEQADGHEVPAGMNVTDEIVLRQERLARPGRGQASPAGVGSGAPGGRTGRVRSQTTRVGSQSPAHRPQAAGCPPTPPASGPQAKDQYNFTDPESRIMKSSRSGGFEQAYNAQVVVDQGSFFIVACSLSNHPNDKAEAEPTLAALPPALGTPAAAALDNGFWSEQNRTALEERQIEPYIATGREPHHQSWQERFAAEPEPPAEDASPQIKMAYKLRTEIGQAIYRLRKCTVEPVIGIIKAVLGFRQFSLRGLDPADCEWCLVCLAFNLKRLHTLSWA